MVSWYCVVASYVVIYVLFFSLMFQYNAKEASVKLVYEAQPRPRPIAAIASKSITKVACGNNHSGLFLPHLKLFSSCV